jgi:hypothetical protein
MAAKRREKTQSAYGLRGSGVRRESERKILKKLRNWETETLGNSESERGENQTGKESVE